MAANRSYFINLPDEENVKVIYNLNIKQSSKWCRKVAVIAINFYYFSLDNIQTSQIL